MNVSFFDDASLAATQERIGLRFRDLSLLRTALTHSSLLNEWPTLSLSDNQRLEFLGDAVLTFVVAEWLYSRYPDASEGELTTLRSYVVRKESLAALAREIDLGPDLRLAKGEAASGGASRTANLCDAFEALVGAIFMDTGLRRTRAWIRRFLTAHALEIDSRRSRKDAKSVLQELTQSTRHLTPLYQIVAEEGPAHARVFTAQVLVGPEVWGEGIGASKQAAEQAAAEVAMRHRHDEGP